MRRYSSLLVYISIPFLLYYLYRFDYLELGGLRPAYPRLLISVVLLCSAFLIDALAWWRTLSIHGLHVPLSKGIASHGLAIFAKYIPGKLWVILGRAAFISEEGFPLVRTSLVSIKAQVIAIWIGLILGLTPVLILRRFTKLNILSIVIIAFTTAFILNSRTHNWVLHVMSKLTRRRIDVATISLRQTCKISLYYGACWGFFISGFFFLVSAFHPGVSVSVGFVFPLAATLGVLAIVFPGGLGVREGIMAGYLVFTGIPTKEAATISLLSRLWFVFGELFIFSTAFILHRRNKRSAGQPGSH